jgi:MFS family permease
MPTQPGKITQWLERAPAGVLNGYAVVSAFIVYFCVYAFRKPFTAATYDGQQFAGSQIQLKTALVVSWLLGYTVAKYVGTKLVSESGRSRRMWMLIGLVFFAEFTLLLFAIAPPAWKVAAIFLNGFPLGMVFGLVVRYLEGRRTSDILLAGLACSFIIASGVFKDVGRALLAGGTIRFVGIPIPNPLPPLTESWMPVATGLLFLPAFLLAVWLLNQIPEPTFADAAARTEREPMTGERRLQFLLAYLPGLLPLIIAYVFLTIFRDYRDNYQVEVLNQLGYAYEQNKNIMSRMELGVAFGVLATLSLLFLVKDNRRGLLVILAAIAAGFLIIGAATVLHMAGAISGFWWVALIGFGGYLAYVPYNSVLFDRLMASTRFVGTAVFAIYVADSAGYTASCITQIGKDVLAAQTSRTQFLQYFSLLLSVVGTLSVAVGGVYFWRLGRRPPPAT